MATPEIFNIKKSSLLKALLYGHLVNIVIGAVVFLTSHFVFMFSTNQSVVITIIATALVSLVVAILGTQKLGEPFAAMHEELTDLHQKIDSAGNELSRTNQSTEALFENLPTGILVFNESSELTSYNTKALEILHLIPTSDDDVEPGSEMQQPTPINTETTMNALEQFHISGSRGKDINILSWLDQAKLQKIQEAKRWQMAVSTTASKSVACDIIVRYNREETHGYELVIVLVDRTQEYIHQEEQMEFIALAAHELRGPVTVMRGLIDILNQEIGSDLSQEYKTLLDRMGVSARQLAGYIDNILGVSKIDRDTFSVKASENKWEDIVRQATADLALRATARNRKIEIAIDKNLPTAAVDGSSILHVINNLVDNALKYSPDGGVVTVSAKLVDGMIETQVKDFGIGIPANVVTNLFTKFYRSHRSKQIVSGTGLGLYLSKGVVEAHGGTIWVRSTEGVGTTFGFTVPTYESVAESLEKDGELPSGIIRSGHGWIKNHALFRR